MRKRQITGLVGAAIAIVVGLAAAAESPWPVLVQDGDRVVEVPLAEFAENLVGTVSYQGPVLSGEEEKLPQPVLTNSRQSKPRYRSVYSLRMSLRRKEPPYPAHLQPSPYKLFPQERGPELFFPTGCLKN